MKSSFLVILLIVCSHGIALAQDGQERVRFDEYFTVAAPAANPTEELTEISDVELNPVEILWSGLHELGRRGDQVFSLLRFEHHAEAYGDVTEPYKRMKHFGTWITTQPDGRCGNTRAEVLKRDSLVPVTMSASGCTVARGKWDDPYTGRTFTAASDIQIDHFVPLKNAYLSGADKWTGKKRCLYANFLGNQMHLLPVSGPENSKKSDRSPEGYMPPNRAYQCQYLAQWLKIKMIWELGLTPPEKEAIQVLAQENHCTVIDLSYTQNDLTQQRRFIKDNMNLCH